VEDGIPRWLHHHQKACHEEGGHCGRQALIIRR